MLVAMMRLKILVVAEIEVSRLRWLSLQVRGSKQDDQQTLY
jgi:hypothetical protein